LLKLFPESLPDEAAISSNPLAGAFVIEYSLVCVAFGGYLTAWIAGRSPVKHALDMGGVQLLFTAFAMISFFAQAPLRNWVAALLLTGSAGWDARGQLSNRATRLPSKRCSVYRRCC